MDLFITWLQKNSEKHVRFFEGNERNSLKTLSVIGLSWYSLCCIDLGLGSLPAPKTVTKISHAHFEKSVSRPL